MLLDTFLPKRSIRKGVDGKEHFISFLKGVSWRVVGTLDTIMISYFVTGKIHMALSIGSVEVFTKITLFYFHDRLWELAKAKKINVQQHEA
jgi:uncharacterized membrane protein